MARPRSNGRAPRRASRLGRGRAAVARRAVPEPAVRPALDHGSLAGVANRFDPHRPLAGGGRASRYIRRTFRRRTLRRRTFQRNRARGARFMISVDIARNAPRNVEVVGVPVANDGPVPRQVGLSRAALASHGFEGKVGQTLVVPSATSPTVIAVGIGPADERTPATLRTAAAALARAAAKRSTLTTSL